MKTQQAILGTIETGNLQADWGQFDSIMFTGISQKDQSASRHSQKNKCKPVFTKSHKIMLQENHQSCAPAATEAAIE